jgi:hypothetical protein
MKRGLPAAHRGQDRARDRLAQLHAELVERIDAPDDALHEYLVLVDGEQCPQVKGVQRRQHEGRAHAVARAGLVGLRRGEAFHQRLRLGERVREQDLVVLPQRSHGLRHDDEVARGGVGALVQPLVERMLSRRLGATPHHRAGGEIDRVALQVHALAVRFHLELLQVGGQALQARGVREHRVARRTQRVAVPDTHQRQQRRHVVLEGRGAEDEVGGVGAGEHLLEALHAEPDRHRQSHGRPQRIAPAHPIGEREGVAVGQPEALRLGEVRARGDHVPGDGLLAERGGDPVARRARVLHRLLRGVGLRGHHHQRGGGVEALHGVGEFRRVDVGDEAHLGTVGLAAQRLDRQARPQRGAADAECQHVADALAGMALPVAAAHRLGEAADALAVALDLGQQVLAVDHHVLVAAQRRVQRGPVLGRVHAFAGEELLDRRGHAAVLGERHQELERAVGDALLGEIDVDPGAAKGERGPAVRIVLPELREAPAGQFVAVRKERLPRGGCRKRDHLWGGLLSQGNSNPVLIRRFPGPSPRRPRRAGAGRLRGAGAPP